MSAGKLHPRDVMFFREAVGEATLGEEQYELCTHAGDRTPLVRNKRTGRTWSISWQQLIEMARGAGVDADEVPA